MPLVGAETNRYGFDFLPIVHNPGITIDYFRKSGLSGFEAIFLGASSSCVKDTIEWSSTGKPMVFCEGG
jgi:hypothetical protein